MILDLLIKTRDLIRDNDGVRHELQRVRILKLVDEEMRIALLQTEILLLLAADDPSVIELRLARPVSGKLFLVGDPKQSIYRVRRADVALHR